LPVTNLPKLHPSEWCDLLEDAYGVPRPELSLFAVAVVRAFCQSLASRACHTDWLEF
jgi:hypothetical protein